MEKYIFVVLIVIFTVFLLSVEAAQKRPTVSPVSKQCMQEENATDDDLMNLKMHTKPATKAMKCLLACTGEKSGKIVNNKLNGQQVLKSIKTLPHYSEQLQQSVSEVLTECNNVQDPDRCEFASKVSDCLAAGATKRGIKLQTLFAH